MAQPVRTIAEGLFQVAFDRSDADLQTHSHLLRRLPIDRYAAKHFPRPGREFGQSAFERLDFRAPLDDLGRIWRVVANVQKRVDLRWADAIVLGFLTILGDIDGDTKNVIAQATN